MKSISIVGFGRFGETLLTLFGDDFKVGIFTRSEKNKERIPKQSNIRVLHTANEIYEAEAIFYCVPISQFESILTDHAMFIHDEHTLLDVLSVKLHPKTVFERVLKTKKTQAILTHPMFGPDSSKNGFSQLPLILDQFRADDKTYTFWKTYFESKLLNVIEMTPDEHDRQAADSQGLTHFVGRLLQEYGYKQTQIDSLGATKLREIMDQVCNDTWELYYDLERYNPYTKDMVKKLDSSFERLHKKTFTT
ncbi:prephenate dehydrogenase/arogenate dehydrogenase family protein [Candidatus Microgenomates bacterium]|nr:prephenate dehydrogenase/arogenate dehydrogenase family protein [Candidatus Microgenomates bacterium]